ncbi:hypothetical protein HZ996_04250 [Cryomorphaceae bacterium]|nr:hypothetical protein HZ996_04250 [Cryomorphaceae bacterium]
MTQLIGIGGLSQAGKTTLAAQLAAGWSDRRVAVLEMDSFGKPESELPLWVDAEGNSYRDWEHPESIDYDLLVAAVQQASTDHDIVIVEGILVFHDARLWNLFDTRVLLEVEDDLFWERRRRDVRWGAESDAYLQHVLDAYTERKKGLDLEDLMVFRSSNPSDEAFKRLLR